MKYILSDFNYDLPDRLIAQEPAHPRDHARLLVYDRNSATIKDDYFYNLPAYLPPETTLVLNNSKVEKARLLFGKTEIFIIEAYNNRTVKAMVRPGRKFRKERDLELADGIRATVTNIDKEGLRTITFNRPLDDPLFDRYRHTPFPPYIKPNEKLADEYQTVYARDAGSKAAPTAGLHFTEALLQKISDSGIRMAEVTLHVGLGTFAPVKTENIEDHHLHSEWFEIPEKVAEILNEASDLTAVGTTSVRVLESSVESGRRFSSTRRNTEIFIKPGYDFKAVDHLITNFHLPKSTLLMLVAAFMGYDEMRRVYEHAVREEYRFFSFGDAMIII